MVFDKKNKIIKITWRNAKRKKCAWFVKMHSTAYVRGKKNALTVKKNRRANDRKCYYFQKRIEENKLRAEERTSKQESRRTIEENRDLTRRENKGTKKFWGKGNERTGEDRMDLVNDKEN